MDVAFVLKDDEMMVGRVSESNESDKEFGVHDPDPPIYCLFCNGTETQECEECDGSGCIQTGEDASENVACDNCKNGIVVCKKCLVRESGYNG